jgi:hypothetical protein
MRLYEPLGVYVDCGSLSVAQAESLSVEDMELLSLGLRGNWPWLRGQIPLGHVLLATTVLRWPRQRVEKRLTELGLTVSIPVHQDLDAELDEQLLSVLLDAISEWTGMHAGTYRSVGNVVQSGYVLYAARTLEMPAVVVARKLLAMGFSLGVDPVVLEHVKVDELSMCLLSVRLDGKPPFIDGDVELGRLLAVARKFGWSLRDTAQRYIALAPLGAHLSVDGTVIANANIGHYASLLFSIDWRDRHPWIGGRK